MKLRQNIFSTRGKAGMFLLECLVYMAVFLILLSIGTATFYFCWDHSKALIYTTDDISAALRAGERWRADVRDATGKIVIETNSTGETATVPEGQKEIIYRFASGELRRQIAGANFSQLMLPKVKSSQMKMELRGGVKAWRWELELKQRRKETHLPLLFTFEAAQTKP